jgi:hypothetical protein
VAYRFELRALQLRCYNQENEYRGYYQTKYLNNLADGSEHF